MNILLALLMDMLNKNGIKSEKGGETSDDEDILHIDEKVSLHSGDEGLLDTTAESVIDDVPLLYCATLHSHSTPLHFTSWAPLNTFSIIHPGNTHQFHLHSPNLWPHRKLGWEPVSSASPY